MKLLLVLVILCVIPGFYTKPALTLGQMKRVLESAQNELREVAWDSYASSVHAQFSDTNAPTKYEIFSFDEGTYSTVAAVMDGVDSGQKLGLTVGDMAIIHYLFISGDDTEVGMHLDIGEEQYTISSKDDGNDYTAQKDGNSILVRSLDEYGDNILVALCPSANDSCSDLVDELSNHVYSYSY